MLKKKLNYFCLCCQKGTGNVVSHILLGCDVCTFRPDTPDFGLGYFGTGFATQVDSASLLLVTKDRIRILVRWFASSDAKSQL